jgi:hypothetical protein
MRRESCLSRQHLRPAPRAVGIQELSRYVTVHYYVLGYPNTIAFIYPNATLDMHRARDALCLTNFPFPTPDSPSDRTRSPELSNAP